MTFKKDDGWDNDIFKLLLDAQDNLDNLGYEIRNCVRKRSLSEIKIEIENIIDDLELMKDSMR